MEEERRLVEQPLGRLGVLGDDALRDPLQASMLELMVAAGHVSEQEAGLADVPAPDPQFRDLRDAIRRDGQLSQDLKDLLLVQYEAMLALSRAREQERRSAS